MSDALMNEIVPDIRDPKNAERVLALSRTDPTVRACLTVMNMADATEVEALRLMVIVLAKQKEAATQLAIDTASTAELRKFLVIAENDKPK